MKKERLDILVQRRAAVAESKARGLILTGKVFDGAGTRLDKPGDRFDEDIELVVEKGRRYVSRGGLKLEAALDALGLDPSGLVALDAGASTGGFTDCLLQHGAAKVYAVDVGYGQLDWSLRQDARVAVLERTNVRHLTKDDLEEAPSFFTVDCSFISLGTVLPPLKALLARPAEGVVLIKPQFEAERGLVEEGGVISDPRVHEEVIAGVKAACAGMGFSVGAVIPSPLLGPAGNKEFLLHLTLDG